MDVTFGLTAKFIDGTYEVAAGLLGRQGCSADAIAPEKLPVSRRRPVVSNHVGGARANRWATDEKSARIGIYGYQKWVRNRRTSSAGTRHGYAV